MVRILFSVFLVVVTGAFGLGRLRTVQDPAAPAPALLRQVASTLAEEGRWADLRDYLARLDEAEIPAASRAWWTVTLLDARWRAAAGSRNADDGELQAARAALETFAAAATPGQPRDEVWARAQESLGDWHWRRAQARNLHGALPHYQAALEFWAASPDIGRARERYLAIAFGMFEPDGQRDAHAWWLGQVPLKVVRDARSVAVAPAERARATLILARRLLQDGHPAARREAIGCLRELCDVESPAAGRDEVLHLLARELEQNGEPRVGPDGILESQPAFDAALALFRRLLAEYPRGTSAWRDEAEQGIARILQVSLDVAVDGAFFPESEVGYALAWRNVGPIQLTLHPLDLARDVRFQDDRSADAWVDSVDVGRIEPVQSFTHVPRPTAPHAPGRELLRLERAPAPGAYALVARAGQASARALVLVGSTGVVLKTSGDQALVWCFDARTSEPLRSADVWLAERWWDGRERRLATQAARTDADGLARVALKSGRQSTEVFAAVTAGERTAFATCGRSWWHDPDVRARVLAFTDRAAYRPNQTVQWKAIARTSDGGAWRVPAGATLDWKIHDPRGAVWKEGSSELNAFGSVSGALELTAAMALGEYQLEAHVQEGQHTVHAGRALLFRLEEYRLPEFEVRVAPAQAGPEAARPVLGDTLPIDVDVAFYSGGPVAGAAVEVVVTQRGFQRAWPRPYETRWGAPEETRSRRVGREHGQVVLRQQLVTDARGHARFEIATPAGAGRLEYEVEARAVDASRREVVGSGSVRVGATEYEVDVRTDRRVHGPGRAALVELEALDVNGRPVAATGLLRLMQERWREVWLDPRGNEVEGEALDALRRASSQFPPPSSGHPWKRIVDRWESREVARFDVAIGVTGKASATVTPRENGLYRAVWTSRDGRGSPVESEAWFHVADESLRELGNVSNDLELVVDRATVAPGESASVVVLTPVSGRYVLVTLEGLKLFDARVVHVAGRAAFLRVPLSLDHVPDVYLNAFTANAGVPWRTSEEITVPPADRLLTVEVRPDQPARLPGEEGDVEVLVRDARGEPVQAEVALAVVDDALAAIQADPTPEIGSFFHGDRRGSMVQTGTTLDRLRFRRWILDAEGQLRDERELDREKAQAGSYRGASDTVPPGGAGLRGSRAVAQSAEAAAAGLAEMAKDSSARAGESRRDAGHDGGELAVRSDFRETAFWAPHLVTDVTGRARATFRYPDSLTRWRITARAATATTQVGEARGAARTDKPLVARLAIPRFLVAEDVVTVSGLVDNKTEAPLRVKVGLALDGPLALVGGRDEEVSVQPGETARVNWLVRASGAGTGRLVLRATSPGGSDALDKTLPCIPGGVDSLVARAGRVGPSGELALVLDVPGERVREATAFAVDVAPSLAVTMLDALPYLVDYPYGCTEQTLSRFLPAAIVAHTLQQRGLSPDEALARAFGGIEREHAAATHARPGAGLKALAEAVEQGLRRLVDFQHQDGGWGWWKEGASDRWMSAYVVWGLSLARDAGVDVPGDALRRGVSWLAHELVEAQADAPLAAWMLHAVAQSKLAQDDRLVTTALDKLLRQREALDAYGRSLAVLACAGFGRADDARRMAATLANGVQVEKDPESSRIGAGTASSGTQGLATAHWGADGAWRRWSDSPVETTAFALRALLAVDPAHPLAEPAMRWLVQNRRGASWSNTRDTAIAVLALDRWLEGSGEIARDVGYELYLNGRSVARRTVTAAEMLRAPARFEIAAADVRDGRNEVRVVRTAGAGPLHVAASARFTSLERPIPARGNQVFVRREAWKLVPRPTLLAGWAFDREPLEDGGEVKSGERVVVVLTVEAKNDLEYLLLEDPRAAGFEAVDVKSGGPAFARELNAAEVRRRFDPTAVRLFPDPLDASRSTGRQCWAHRELRDRHAAWFLDRLPQGVWELSYELVAEAPGRFRALPVRAEAMYVPEIRGHGTDIVVGVLERARGM